MIKMNYEDDVNYEYYEMVMMVNYNDDDNQWMNAFVATRYIYLWWQLCTIPQAKHSGAI